MAEIADAQTGSSARRRHIGWILVGFALGGFFDGIVLHQILQWHHLLSGLDDPAGSNLRFQVAADGMFHLAMYLVGIAGAVLVFTAGGHNGAGGRILRYVLIGFGGWHVIDAVVSHWLLGIHRIRMDSDVPLFWDVAWLAIFGIVPLLVAYMLPPGRGTARSGTVGMLAVALTAGLTAALGPRFAESGETIVVFRGGLEQAEMMRAVAQADARLVWTDASGTVWAVDGLSLSGLATLYAHGALLVGSTPFVAGCLAWTRRPQAI